MIKLEAFVEGQEIGPINKPKPVNTYPFQYFERLVGQWVSCPLIFRPPIFRPPRDMPTPKQITQNHL